MEECLVEVIFAFGGNVAYRKASVYGKIYNPTGSQRECGLSFFYSVRGEIFYSTIIEFWERNCCDSPSWRLGLECSK